MSHLQPIYDVWGGNAEAMAADIGELGVTVRQWRNRRDIPSRAWPKIIKAAADKGASIRLEDFLAPDVKSEMAGHDAAHNASGAMNQNLTEWPLDQSDSAEGAPPFAPAPEERRSSGAFPQTSSPTNARSSSSPASPACPSSSEAEAA